MKYIEINPQGRSKLSPDQPSVDGDTLLKSALLKSSSSDGLKSFDELSLTSGRDLNASNCQEYEMSDDNELQNFENISQPSKDYSRNATPSSYSEISLDAARSQDCLTTRSAKKRVNINTDFVHDIKAAARSSPPSSSTAYEDLESGETSVLNGDLDQFSLYKYNTHVSTTDSYITMTGTVKRGRKKGQSVDLQLNISREELEKINAAARVALESTAGGPLQRHGCCVCTPTTGVHILMLSLVCLPFVTVVTSIYSFYIGTLTWYNMFNYFYEEKSYLHKLLMSPLLVVAYPVLIVLCTVGLGIYAGLIQLSVRFTSWFNEIADIEKGFYGWLCSVLHLSDCSPYEVVILMDMRPTEEATGGGAVTGHTQSSTEELSL